MKHRRALFLSIALAIPSLLMACGPSITTSGINAKEYFVITEGWVWQYTNAGYTELYEVWAMGEQPRSTLSVYVFQWKFATAQALAEDEASMPHELFFMETYWQKTDQGVYFRGADAVDSDQKVPPAWDEILYERQLEFAGVDIRPEDMWESSSDGEKWTGEYVESLDTYDTPYTEFTNVMHIRFTDESGTSPFGGDYFLAKSQGVVGFILAAHPDEEWKLKKLTN